MLKYLILFFFYKRYRSFEVGKIILFVRNYIFENILLSSIILRRNIIINDWNFYFLLKWVKVLWIIF